MKMPPRINIVAECNNIELKNNVIEINKTDEAENLFRKVHQSNT